MLRALIEFQAMRKGFASVAILWPANLHKRHSHIGYLF